MCRPDCINCLGVFVFIDGGALYPFACTCRSIEPSGKIVSISCRIFQFVGCRCIAKLSASVYSLGKGLVERHGPFRRMCPCSAVRIHRKGCRLCLPFGRKRMIGIIFDVCILFNQFAVIPPAFERISVPCRFRQRSVRGVESDVFDRERFGCTRIERYGQPLPLPFAVESVVLHRGDC